MNIKIAFFVTFIFATNHIVAQKVFKLNNSSKKYFAIINVEKCDSWNCEGKGIVKIYDRKTKKLQQTFTSGNLYTELDRKANVPTENHHQLYDGTSVIIFDDFNFDGFEDLAIRNGNLGLYRGPSYDIYIYRKKDKIFKLNLGLTDIATRTGMFFIDKKRQRLITREADGYSKHITTEYKVISGRPYKVLITIDECLDKNNYEITTQTLIKNKWKTTKRKFKKKD